ncbi:SMC-Scp complex subunit ScpB [Oceanobacter mangrovi]|uniref:SMC-Scp complex subunit ScpB n=1 Tax=Oceanobacter mangrovi TaxID=2862510 RepID=UPI001FE7E372|nr:SMC-Scp complex subunit ScpB [Oceanobacter mangrovi]
MRLMTVTDSSTPFTTSQLAEILEAALLAHGTTLSLERMGSLFEDNERPLNAELRAALEELAVRLEGRGIELKKVASGYRLQVRQHTMPWVSRLWEEKPPRYSRALLETLALIAYRQPVTRGDIEDVRGVVVSSNIIRTLLERDWIKVVGHRDVPGRPALYATTPDFLDYFGLSGLEQLPSLMAIRELDDANRRLALGDDAEARRPTAEDYDFSSDEDVARRGADVLDATAEDLAVAEALMARVEQNLFGNDEDGEGDSDQPRIGRRSSQKSLGELVSRFEATDEPEPSDLNKADPDEAAGDKENNS